MASAMDNRGGRVTFDRSVRDGTINPGDFRVFSAVQVEVNRPRRRVRDRM